MRWLNISAGILGGAHPWDLHAHLCEGSHTHTHTYTFSHTLVLSCSLEFKANIYILRLLCIYAELPAPPSMFGKPLLVSSC